MGALGGCTAVFCSAEARKAPLKRRGRDSISVRGKQLKRNARSAIDGWLRSSRGQCNVNTPFVPRDFSARLRTLVQKTFCIIIPSRYSEGCVMICLITDLNMPQTKKQ